MLGVVGGTFAALALAEWILVLTDTGPKINVIYRENYRLSADEELLYELVPGSPDGELAIVPPGGTEAQTYLYMRDPGAPLGWQFFEFRGDLGPEGEWVLVDPASKLARALLEATEKL